MNDFLSDLIITDVRACNRINLSAGTKTKRVNRECFAVALKTKGRTFYFKDGNKFVSDSAHACILTRGSTYYFECMEAGECLMVEFDVFGDRDFDFLSFPLKNPKEAYRLFRITERALNIKNGRLGALGGLYALLAEIGKTADYVSPRPSLLPATEYIDAHLSCGVISNETLAALCGISCVYFRKVFTKRYGMPPSEYIAARRVRKAENLMLSDFSSMSDIADACGFSSVGHFSRVFKKVTGATPREYRLSPKDPSARQSSV